LAALKVETNGSGSHVNRLPSLFDPTVFSVQHMVYRTAPLNRYTCYGAIEVVAIIIIIIIKQNKAVIARTKRVHGQYSKLVLQVAQLSQRGRAMLRVIEYFAKSLKVIRNDTVGRT